MNSDQHSYKGESVENYLYSFSSRCNSPKTREKRPKTPSDCTDHNKTGSFLSISTSITRFSSMSGTHDIGHRSEDPVNRLKDKILRIQDEIATGISDKVSSVGAERVDFEEVDFENGIPTLRWCAYCGGETATEVSYANTEKTFWSSVAIFLSGGVCGCFLLPYALDSCKNMEIRCHKCKRIVT